MEKVNSQKLKLPSGKILKGEERKIFETKKIKLDVLKSEKAWYELICVCIWMGISYFI